MDYKNGKIYKLVSFETDKVYVGSTTQSLSRRKTKHKSDYKRWMYGNYHYVSSYEIIKYDDFDIILLEQFPCNSKMELHKREREYIEKIDCVNKVIPRRTKKEYYDSHKDEISVKRKQYREDHKDEIKEKRKEKYTCECGSTLTLIHKSRHEKSLKHVNYLNSIK